MIFFLFDKKDWIKDKESQISSQVILSIEVVKGENTFKNDQNISVF